MPKQPTIERVVEISSDLPQRGSMVFEIQIEGFEQSAFSEMESSPLYFDTDEGITLCFYRCGFIHDVTEPLVRNAIARLEMCGVTLTQLVFLPYSAEGCVSKEPGTNHRHFQNKRDAALIASRYKSTVTFSGQPLVKFNSTSEKDF